MMVIKEKSVDHKKPLGNQVMNERNPNITKKHEGEKSNTKKQESKSQSNSKQRNLGRNFSNGDLKNMKIQNENDITSEILMNYFTGENSLHKKTPLEISKISETFARKLSSQFVDSDYESTTSKVRDKVDKFIKQILSQKDGIQRLNNFSDTFTDLSYSVEPPRFGHEEFEGTSPEFLLSLGIKPKDEYLKVVQSFEHRRMPSTAPSKYQQEDNRESMITDVKPPELENFAEEKKSNAVSLDNSFKFGFHIESNLSYIKECPSNRDNKNSWSNLAIDKKDDTHTSDRAPSASLSDNTKIKGENKNTDVSLENKDSLVEEKDVSFVEDKKETEISFTQIEMRHETPIVDNEKKNNYSSTKDSGFSFKPATISTKNTERSREVMKELKFDTNSGENNIFSDNLKHSHVIFTTMDSTFSANSPKIRSPKETLTQTRSPEIPELKLSVLTQPSISAPHLYDLKESTKLKKSKINQLKSPTHHRAETDINELLRRKEERYISISLIKKICVNLAIYAEDIVDEIFRYLGETVVNKNYFIQIFTVKKHIFFHPRII